MGSNLVGLKIFWFDRSIPLKRLFDIMKLICCFIPQFKSIGLTVLFPFFFNSSKKLRLTQLNKIFGVFFNQFVAEKKEHKMLVELTFVNWPLYLNYNSIYTFQSWIIIYKFCCTHSDSKISKIY